MALLTEMAPVSARTRAAGPVSGISLLHQTGVECLIYVGPPKPEAALTGAPLPQPIGTTGDVTVPAGFLAVTASVEQIAGSWDGHEQTLTLTPAGAAFDSSIWADEAYVLVRARWREDDGDWGGWRCLFLGNVIQDQGSAEARARTRLHAGAVTCKQEWFYLSKQPLSPLSLGVVDAAEGRSCSADSVLTNLAAENGVEYLSATSVAPDMATDGNVDTLWVSNLLADGASPGWMTLPNWTGKMVKIVEVYSGSAGGGIGANGLPRYVILYAADGKYFSDFEGAGNTGGVWKTHYGGAYSRTTTAGWIIRGSASLLVLLPNKDAGISQEWTGLEPEVEAVVRFSIRALALPSGHPQPMHLQALVAGMGSTHVEDMMLTTTPRIVTIRKQANSAGIINLRFKSMEAGVYPDYHAILDDLTIVGGVKLQDEGQPYAKLWLVWDDGLGGSGYADLVRAFGLETMAAETFVALTDDADLFAARFDPGPNCQVVQYREVPGLRALDFASGRGRLRLAYYRRWPDLSGSDPTNTPWESVDAERRWDDLKINEQPAFAITASLRRIGAAYAQSGVSTQVMVNPAPAGDATGAPTWLDVDLGDYPATTLQAACGAGAGEVVTVESVDGYAAYGYAWLDLERVWYEVTGATTIKLVQRGVSPGPAASTHAAGTKLWPDQNGVRVTAPLIAAVGIRRRPGTPRLIDFTLLGSILPTPPDPGSGPLIYESHPQWFPLATVRNNTRVSPTYLLGSRPGDVTQIDWPPAPGTAFAWGREIRHLRIIVQRMEQWQGQPQRAKLNAIVAYAADLQSSVGGGYSGSAPPDLKDAAIHILTAQAGIPISRVTSWRGEGSPLPWGRHYGTLKTAAGSAAEVLQGLESRGGLRVICRPDNTIEIIPDPLTTSASMANVERFWTPATIEALTVSRSPVRAVAQVRVVARNRDSGETFSAVYPRTRRKYGAVVEAGDLVLGDQQATNVQAQRLFRQGNARWSVSLTTWSGPPPTPYRRNVLDDPAMDEGGVLLAGTNVLVTGYSWTINARARGQMWELTVELEELAPWS